MQHQCLVRQARCLAGRSGRTEGFRAKLTALAAFRAEARRVRYSRRLQGQHGQAEPRRCRQPGRACRNLPGLLRLRRVPRRPLPARRDAHGCPCRTVRPRSWRQFGLWLMPHTESRRARSVCAGGCSRTGPGVRAVMDAGAGANVHYQPGRCRMALVMRSERRWAMWPSGSSRGLKMVTSRPRALLLASRPPRICSASCQVMPPGWR